MSPLELIESELFCPATKPYSPPPDVPYELIAMRDALAECFEFELHSYWWNSDDRNYPKGEGIYILREEDLSWFYVGRTKNFRRRLGEHRRSNFYVHHSHAPHYLYLLVADTVPDETLKWAEDYFIEQLRPWVNLPELQFWYYRSRRRR
jgi:hypothetical protein